MKSRLISRIERLESRTKAMEPRTICYGWVIRLVKFAGESHVAIVKRVPTRSPRFFWCQFEERPGPSPSGSDNDDA
jgi:hypothetical protein